MRRKKLLRQIAAAAVALSMAVSLSAPAFAATFDLSNGGLVITAGESGITVKRDDGTSSTYGADEEIVITGSYSSANGATQTAEENRQEENQPVTPAKAPAKEETSEETPEAEDTSAAEKKQEQKDTEAPADPEQKTETENKDNNSDPDNEEKKEQNAPANGELNASAGEGQEPKAEDEGQPKPEAKASAVASTSASDDTSNDASNGPRKAPARSSGEKSERLGIIQIFANTAEKLVKLTLKNATIDQPYMADTSVRGTAAIDIQGKGNVQITVEGDNLLTGKNRSAAIQKNDDVSTGKLTITAQDTNQKLTVKEGGGGITIGGEGYTSVYSGGRHPAPAGRHQQECDGGGDPPLLPHRLLRRVEQREALFHAGPAHRDRRGCAGHRRAGREGIQGVEGVHPQPQAGGDHHRVHRLLCTQAPHRLPVGGPGEHGGVPAAGQAAAGQHAGAFHPLQLARSGHQLPGGGVLTGGPPGGRRD